MTSYRRRWNGRWWTVYSERDGLLGWISPVAGGWEWTTDLRGLRIAQQLGGRAPTIIAAQENFKAVYEQWRSRFTDEHFNKVYRRSPPETKKARPHEGTGPS